MAPTVPIEFTGQREFRSFSLSQTMGKSRKYSKGHSCGFVPDYRHAIETIGESEGFGSSGRVDTEMTASEDSCTPKRKCISLNVDGYEGFSVPMQVLSLSRMSQSGRKHLKLKLKMELEKVQLLQKKIENLSSNTGIFSPSSDIRSCSDGHQRHLENSQRLSEVSTPQAKKPAPPGRSGPHTKRNLTGRFAPAKPPAPATTANAMLMKQCETLLKRLKTHKFGWVFNAPVDVEKMKIPDYFTVIKHPMDLGTIDRKLTSGEYSSPLYFAADVRLTFSNAMTYNPPGNDVHVMADDISRFFEVRWKSIERKIITASSDAQLMPSGNVVRLDAENTTSMPPSKKKKSTPIEASVKQEIVKRDMTDEEKHKLGIELEALLGELPESIIYFLKEHSAGQTSEDEFEIDIDALSNDTLFSLRKLLKDYLTEKQKKETKAETFEMVINELGFSNSSIPPCKGIARVDDVDIVGGNDSLVSSFPQVEIRKDATQKISKSNSSAGCSGSLSSDTDSATSSESESNAVKATHSLNAAKKIYGTSSDQKRCDPDDKEIDNHAINGVAQVEQNSQSKPISVEVDEHQEGENAPSDRQVSPDKLYRAALLKNRFADTILKAREKALEKDEKRDPDKLRKEREELERRQREEKARLQAEAKAAEEARKKAEAEAAAEARRKRELEREAARRALQDMEKTVDIDENTHFLESLPNFMEEASPEPSENALGSFKLQGSNPLEQLGLYMKDDDEYEEEDEPLQSNPEEPSNDVEEGEID